MDKPIIRKPATIELSFMVPRPAQCTSAEQRFNLGREAQEETQRQLGQALWPYVSKESTKDGILVKVSIFAPDIDLRRKNVVTCGFERDMDPYNPGPIKRSDLK